MNVTTVRKRGKLIIRFFVGVDSTKDGASVSEDKSRICQAKKDISTLYRTPDVVVGKNGVINLILRSSDTVELDNIELFVKSIFIPKLNEYIFSCRECTIKKTPLFCARRHGGS